MSRAAPDRVGPPDASSDLATDPEQEAQQARLASGIAHEIDNVLCGIDRSVQQARRLLAEDTPAGPSLDAIETAARRAADLCSQLLSRARIGVAPQESCDLNQLLARCLSALEPCTPAGVQRRLHLAQRLPPVRCDPLQLRQLFTNLLRNAIEAVPDPGGLVTVTTRTRELAEGERPDARGEAALPAGPYVCVEIADNGCGMAPEVQERIFEPFFSTKARGRGVGLASSLDILRGHEGTVWLESEPGAGATFWILLPIDPTRSDSAGPPEG